MIVGPGARLGSYEVLSPLGAGGMGEVYQARDTKLGREVALKILRPLLREDATHLARFRREAQVLAAISHPHIATVHELNEAEGVAFLVMELVPGETLRSRLALGPLPIADALRTCSQVAAALEAAHEKEIVHRDLKPENTKITPDGVVKVLDFGLAKPLKAPGTDGTSDSPTSLLTQGLILGTIPYMSPEQVRGKSIDRRSDIWAFGCMLFETLTGRRPFGGETASDIIAAILEREPDWRMLPAATPPAIEALIRRCLQKDPGRRLKDIGDARLELEEALTAPAAVIEAPVGRRARLKSFPPAIAGAAIGLAVGALVWMAFGRQPRGAVEGPAHFLVPLPPGERLANTDFPAVAISPDGSLLAYVGTRGGRPQLYLRPMNSLDATPIPGAADAIAPFFSPDSRWVAFFAAGQLKKVFVAGGAPVTVTDAPIGFGGSWGSDDTIVFAPATGSGLLRVPAGGGKPTRLTTVDPQKGEFSHRWPELLPDGKSVLFTVGTVGSWDDAQIVGQSLTSSERAAIVHGGTNPHYLSSGHLVYARGGALMAVPFDATRLQIRGTPVRVLDNVLQSFDGAAQVSLSRSGSIVYAGGSFETADRRLISVERTGAAAPLAAPPRPYSAPRVSPDGRKVAVRIAGKADDIWIYDVTQAKVTQLTFEASTSSPVWTPDGERVTFSSTKSGAPNLFVTTLFQGPEERLTSSDNLQVPGSWSPDGRTLAFVERHPTTGRDIWTLSYAGDRTSRPFLASPFDESAPRFSPDGRWIAYVSNESGQNEVYVCAFGDAARRWQVSSGGGAEPVWARGGQELFYRARNRMQAAAFIPGASPRAAASRVLFEDKFEKGTIDVANYDVTPDPLRFVMVRATEEESLQNQLHIVLNWLRPEVAAAFAPR